VTNAHKIVEVIQGITALLMPNNVNSCKHSKQNQTNIATNNKHK